MSPFMVYLMFQADSLISFFTGTAIVALFPAALCTCAAVFGTVGDDFTPTVSKSLRRGAIVSVAVLLLASLSATLTPSTKTVAAMVVLPKITSPTALKALGSQEQQLVDAATAALKSLAAPKGPHK